MAQKKIVLAGGTGNIGKLLTNEFVKLGYQVLILSRRVQQSKNSNIKYVPWDGETKGAWVDELEDVDTIINLSGKSIQCRFTEENKKELLASRILPTKVLGAAIVDLMHPPRLWINFSGISVFEGLDGFHDEDSKDYAQTFLANLTKKWEETFENSITPKTQKVILRLSPVLSKEFGMFKELYPLAKFGLGGKVGNGQQNISWIHESDLIAIVLWIINQEKVSNLYHACVPKPESNELFMQTLRQAVSMPIGFPLPAFLAKIGAYFKGVESDMLLLTNAVEAKRLSQEGFIYKYPTTQKAFEHLTKEK
ncbi:MAG: TIGR01777 family oxidoreductase [Sphingobacterium composti]|uniref:TIGR01777 family oxidoreductase n=1 Tax=Sphingobacterium composti TaxID=363260 RepID=UPI00135B8FC0|nr:TIGR01777 family oxidoreductase [Sphingobacterium composti Ten et al. 2007 non Yoo et al. 2007]